MCGCREKIVGKKGLGKFLRVVIHLGFQRSHIDLKVNFQPRQRQKVSKHALGKVEARGQTFIQSVQTQLRRDLERSS